MPGHTKNMASMGKREILTLSGGKVTLGLGPLRGGELERRYSHKSRDWCHLLSSVKKTRKPQPLAREVEGSMFSAWAPDRGKKIIAHSKTKKKVH